nr:immunoglobulin heavy chain junction region [Macaca mulatta]MOV91868.1 immunoglobulin heavy chain junction region [Macaca mulatta]
CARDGPDSYDYLFDFW